MKINWLKTFFILLRIAVWSFISFKVFLEAGEWTGIAMVLIIIVIEAQLITTKTFKKRMLIFAKKVTKGFELRDKYLKPKSSEELVEEELIRRSKNN